MNRRLVVTIGFLLEIAAAFAVFLPAMIRLQTGVPVTLQTIPVDPRSILRGDYVTLDYVAGQGLPLDWPSNTPVYVVLAKNGATYERVRFSQAKPTLLAGQVCLLGVPAYNRVEFRDLGQYFVPENQGQTLQQAQGSHRLFVDAAVDASCRAIITGLRIGPAAPLEQQPDMMMPVAPVQPIVETGASVQ